MDFASAHALGRLCFVSWFGLLLLSASGCRRSDIRVYDAPKEKVTVRADLPPGWEESPGSAMSVAQYSVHGAPGDEAQVTITPLPGSAGAELDNVNRWRNQLGLKPVQAEDLAKETETVSIGTEEGKLFEIAGTAEGKKARTLAAMLKHNDAVWFFKMMGADQLVRDQKSAFETFLAGYKFPGAPAVETTSTGPSTTLAEDRADTSKWKVPDGWKELPPGPMQEAKFQVGGEATVTVSALAGSGGGLLPNINRWRTQQLGLPAATEQNIEKLTQPLQLPTGEATLVDMAGPAQRMIAAIVPKEGKTWYFKLMGVDAAVNAQKNAFLDFVKSFK